MTIAEYESQVSIFGDIISSIVTDVGYDIRIRNKTGKLATYQRLYTEYLSLDYTMTEEIQEPAYYKAYFLKIK